MQLYTAEPRCSYSFVQAFTGKGLHLPHETQSCTDIMLYGLKSGTVPASRYFISQIKRRPMFEGRDANEIVLYPILTHILTVHTTRNIYWSGAHIAVIILSFLSMLIEDKKRCFFHSTLIAHFLKCCALGGNLNLRRKHQSFLTKVAIIGGHCYQEVDFHNRHPKKQSQICQHKDGDVVIQRHDGGPQISVLKHTHMHTQIYP